MSNKKGKDNETNNLPDSSALKKEIFDDKQIKVDTDLEATPQKVETTLKTESQELETIEKSLQQRERNVVQEEKKLKVAKELISQQETKLNEKHIKLEEMELQSKNGFPKLLEEKFEVVKKQLELREAKCAGEWDSIEKEKEKLRQRNLEVQKAEIQRDNNYTDERTIFDKELSEKRKSEEKEIGKKSELMHAVLDKEINSEREKRLNVLNEELDLKRAKFEDEIFQKRVELKNEEDELVKREQLVEDLELEKDKTKRKQTRLEEELSLIKEEIDRGVNERRLSFEEDKARFREDIANLRDSIHTSNSLISNFEELKLKLGNEDPASVLRRLKTYEEDIRDLRDELATRPTQEMQETFDRIKSEKDNVEREKERYKLDYQNLLNSQQDMKVLEFENDSLKKHNKVLKEQGENIEAHNTQLQANLKRLNASYEREQDREARIRDIETPYINKYIPRATNDVEEIKWLENINESCLNYGLRFPRRILYAFHTAIKTSEWSPITVLAGVSGTGKSELPRLYSHFGGMNFMSLSVQPNWDSQESMLGFFNSIDNKFDAQPVLRLLAQSQKVKSDDYPGLEDVMTLILMDEMNLAHVELYFAEFLSKLELRRGQKGEEVPCLEVKLGAGISHYDLPLGRNVLWAGTMNQDETTKSLSDKVLDRGIVINFPRPTKFERRKKLKPLGEQAPLLSRKLWESWWRKESKFSDEQILPFKKFIEDMNDHLSKVGKALGHRVWQSIEYYMANYPDVLEAQRNKDDIELIKAMRIAFEDQLVQKVMPKLRGIETRGKSRTECLDKILKQLTDGGYSIIEDFNLACEFGYGQFIWNSANYIKDDELEENSSND